MIKLTLLHTNDLHGRIHQVTRIATLARKIRVEVTAAGGTCLYFDAGDSEDTTLMESCLTRGSALDAILRGAGCDQVALGNAIPIRYGPGAVKNLAEHFGKPLLCANMFTADGMLVDGVIPYVLESIGSHQIGVIGLTALFTIYSIFGVTIPPSEQIVTDLVTKVRGEGAKTIVMLSHLGLREDRELAARVAGIDVIIGGHSHNRVNPPEQVNGALIVQAGEYGEVLGRLDLSLDPETGRVITYTSQLIPVDEKVSEDPETLRVVEAEKRRALEMMNIEIGELLEPVECSEDKECTAGNLLADALLEHTPEAQIAFVINGHWNNGLQPGKVTLGELYAANRSAGNPGLVQLTGAQIRQFIHEALKPENISRKPHPLRGRSVGLAHIAGMRVVIDAGNILMWVGDQLVKDDDRLMVVASDMEYSDILGYLSIPDEQVKYDVPTILPEVVEEYIRNHSPLGDIQSGRIIIKV